MADIFRSFLTTGLIVALTLGIGVSVAVAETTAQPAVDASIESLRKEGEALVYASGDGPRDVAKGIALLEQAAAAGDKKARSTLGALYLYGIVTPQDLPRALGYFEAAAAEGDGTGLAQYGMMQMWSETDWKSAQTWLEKAGNMGVGSAWATLAEGAMYGYLGGGKVSRAKFDGYAEKARAAGNARIEVLDATRQMWGISMTASGPLTIKKLEVAADAGNVEAAKYLISLVRTGNQMNIRSDKDRASDYLTKYRALLSDNEAWAYALTIEAAKANTKKRYSVVADEFYAHPEKVTKSLGPELYKANPNVAIYLVQTNLAKTGLYTGPIDGFAGKGTLRAMNKACSGLLDPSVCDDTVMRPDVIGSLVTGR